MTDFQDAVPVEVKIDGRGGVDEGASPHYEISPHLVQQTGHIKGSVSDFYEISPDDVDYFNYEAFQDNYDKNGMYDNDQSQSETAEDPCEVAYLTVDLLFGNNNLLKDNKVENGDQKSSRSSVAGESNYEIPASEVFVYPESDYMTTDELEGLRDGQSNNINNNNIILDHDTRNESYRESNVFHHEPVYEISPKFFDEEDNETCMDCDCNDPNYYEPINE